MSSGDNKKVRNFLSIYYDFLITSNDDSYSILNFISEHMDQNDSILSDPELNTYIEYLIIHFNIFKISIQLLDNKEKGLETLDKQLDMVSGVLLFINQFNVAIIDNNKRSLYFDNLLTKDNKLRTFISGQNREDADSLKQYFIHKEKKYLPLTVFSTFHLLEEACIESLEKNDFQFINKPEANILEKSNDFDEEVSIEDENIFDFDDTFNASVDSITDPYFVIKKLCNFDLPEEDYYNGLTKLNINFLSSFDYDRLLYKSFFYSDTRSFEHLITLYNDFSKVSHTYMNFFCCSGDDLLKYNIVSKFKYSLKFYNQAIQNDTKFLQSLCFDFLKDIESKSDKDFSEQMKLFKLININPFMYKSYTNLHMIHHLLLQSNSTYVLSLLHHFFKIIPTDDYWKSVNDSVGNNFFHICIYQGNFKDLAHYLIEHKELVELFFSPNLNGKRPLDFILESDYEPDIGLMLNILNIIISPDSVWFEPLSKINESHGHIAKKFNFSRENLNKQSLLYPYLKKIIKSLDKHYPVIEDFIMYDVYTPEKVATFETYVKETLGEDNKVLPWVKKLQETSGSKKLLFNTKLKENLSGLRTTFPNFKEFIDHVENYIYLNDMGDGYFWIPPSLLVSAPGIGKTFFLHSLSKVVGVTYDMISMESVTAGFVLVGSTQQWSGGQPGAVFSNVFKSEFANSILILDEVDKAPNSNYPVDPVLLPLLESHTAQKFKDEFVNIPLDISKMVWVATANDIDRISAPIKSRFQVFKIPSPTFEERMILTQAIYTSLLKDNKWGSKFETVIEHSVCFELSRDRNSSRDLRKTILDACGRAAKRKDTKLIIDDLNILNNNKEIALWDKQHD